MTYMPRPGSLAAHACAWFKANPTRKLTLAEICGRWGGTSQTATAQLGAAEDADFLLSERVGRSDVYSAGPKLANWAPLQDSVAEAAAFNPTAAPAPQPAAPAKKTGAVRKRLPPLDITAMKVQTTPLMEPAPGGPNRLGQSQYAPLFEKLEKPNTWIEVPTSYIGALKKAILTYRKTRPERVLRCVKATDTTHQLQRLDDRKVAPAGSTKGQA